MAVLVFASYVETDTVKEAGMTLSIVHDDIVTCSESINGRNNALITEIVKEGILFLFELSKHSFELLVVSGMT